MSVSLYSERCGIIPPEFEFSLTSGEPLPWDNYIVVSQDANGNPQVTDFYLGDRLQFVRTRTYNSQSKITSETIS